jgi:ribonuclease BN (tRNA processing enzyme)
LAVVELTILGTCGAYPGPGRAATGYLLRHDGFNLVIDLGNGALANLQREIRFHDVDAVLVSHSHPDHCVDLYALHIARIFHTEPLEPVPMFTAPGVAERLLSLGGDEDDLRQSFAVQEAEPGREFDVGPFRVQARAMAHWVPAFGYRISVDGSSLAYSGDTGPNDELIELGRGTDVLVLENSWLEGQQAGRPPYHLTARQAGEHAARSGTDHLVLSHFWPTNDRERSREQAAPEFDGAITLADEGMALEVGG